MSVAQAGRSRADSDLTGLLHAWRSGDDTAFSAAIGHVYPELKRIAAQRIGSLGDAATLSPTELVHEAALGMLETPVDFANRVHFFAAVSLAMRAVLVDHARARAAGKRGGDLVRISLSGLDARASDDAAIDLLVLDDALSQLEALDARCGHVMHLAYFGGFDQKEIAGLLDVSVPTVKRDLRFARTWLLKALGDGR